MKFLVIVTLFLMGCEKVKFSKDKEDGVSLKNTMELELKWMESPNSYYIDLSNLNLKKSYEINVAGLEGEGFVVDSSSLMDNRLALSPGEYEIQIGKKINGLRLSVPEDVIIDDSNWEDVLRENSYYVKSNRIFLKNANIKLGENNLVLEAREIVSERSSIVTFSELDQAEQGKRGRDGGNITFLSDSARGAIFLSAKGERGGGGVRPGRNPFLWERASRGRSGKEKTVCMTVGYPPKQKCKRKCKRQPRNGSPGTLQGKKGFPAGNGFPGGSSGDVLVEILHDSDLHPTIQNKVAEGGGPSKPGLGGLGQQGGAPGTNTGKCRRRVVEGARGKEGPLGDVGGKGNPGVSGSICVRVNGHVTQDCTRPSLRQ